MLQKLMDRRWCEIDRSVDLVPKRKESLVRRAEYEGQEERKWQGQWKIYNHLRSFVCTIVIIIIEALFGVSVRGFSLPFLQGRDFDLNV